MTMKKSFALFPAIDLRKGQVVRLRTGDPAQQTTYSSDPQRVAMNWIDQGATWLHVVNLDGAFDEEDAPNRSALESIIQVAQFSGCKVQFGGGLRSLVSIEKALSTGVARVVLGTMAALQPELLRQTLAKFGANQIAIGIDARQGKVSVKGWTEDTALEALQFASDLAEMGIKTLIYTDIGRDGTGQGGNQAETSRLAQVSGLDVIASGGFTSLDEILNLRQDGLSGVILGRALYEGQLDLKACLQALKKGA
jgi:phosphoribosylformimino-5-aminoimidazole carboxamide ribotide isomerase